MLRPSTGRFARSWLPYWLGEVPVCWYGAGTDSHGRVTGQSSTSLPEGIVPVAAAASWSTVAPGVAASVTRCPSLVVRDSPDRRAEKTCRANCTRSAASADPDQAPTAWLQAAGAVAVVRGWYDARTAAPPQ